MYSFRRDLNLCLLSLNGQRGLDPTVDTSMSTIMKGRSSLRNWTMACEY